MLSKIIWTSTFYCLFGFLGGLLCLANLAPVELNIIHTNDLHSYFEPQKDFLHLGGIARIKKLADTLRRSHLNNLFVDGGDWSEGNIMYTVNEGMNTYRIINEMKYDAIALGNHDWLVGAGQVANSLQKSKFNTPILASNLSFTNTPPNSPSMALKEFISSYIIKEMNGVKVAIFGLSTYQLIYDRYLNPIEIIEPTLHAYRMVQYLRNVQKANIVIVLSHLGITQDRLLASCVNGINLIVGAHSHLELHEADLVRYKFPNDSWLTPIVQTGAHGKFLGQTILQYDPETHKTVLNNYRLIPVEPKVDENLALKKLVEIGKKAVINKYGPVFDDQVLINEIPLLKAKKGPSNLTNLVSDAILDYTKADLAFFVNSIIGSDLFVGPISTSDIFNTLPFVIDLKSGRTWQIYSVTMKVKYFKAILNTVLLVNKFFSQIPSISGARIEYDGRKLFEKVISVALIPSGTELKDDQNITISSNRTLLDSIEFIRSKVPMPIENMVEFPIEGWQLLGQYLRKNSVASKTPKGQKLLTYKKPVSILGRLVPVQADLEMPVHDIKQESSYSKNQKLEFTLPIYNLGKTKVPAGALLTVKVNPLPNDELTLPVGSFLTVVDSFVLPEIPAESLVPLKISKGINSGDAMIWPSNPPKNSQRQYIATISNVNPVGGENSAATNTQTFFLRD